MYQIDIVRYNEKKRGNKLSNVNELPNSLKIIKYLIIIFIGFCISILSGLMGIGGGVLMIPTMIFLLGMTQHKAHGSSLAVMSPIVFFTALYYANHGQMDWFIAIELAIGGVIGAGIGANLSSKINAVLLKNIFSLFILVIGIKMIFDVFGMQLDRGEQIIPSEPLNIIQIAVTISIGILTGALSGLLGVGGGIIMIPAMILILGIPQLMAQGISLAVIIPVSISGAIIHAKNGNVDMKTGIWLIVGGIGGALIGANLAFDLDQKYLRCAFAVLLIIISITSLIKKSKQ